MSGVTSSHRVAGESGPRSSTNDVMWDDLQFHIATGKVGLANNPTWEALTTNVYEYSFDIDDYLDLEANEPSHGWIEGTAGKAHIHVTPKDANATGENRFAKFVAYISFATVGGVWAEVECGGELTIPDGTAAKTHFLLSLDDLTLSGVAIGAQIKARIKRIAATGGTEYAANAYVTQVGIHFEHESLGSRQISAK